MITKFFLQLEGVGFPLGEYDMHFNHEGNIVLTLQVGHDNIAVVVLDEGKKIFTFVWNERGDDSDYFNTTNGDYLIEVLDNYVLEHGY